MKMDLRHVVLAIIILGLLLLVLIPTVGRSSPPTPVVPQFYFEGIAIGLVKGECMEYEIDIYPHINMSDVCWDLKLDFPGRVYHESEDKWKSSFYYVEQVICESESKVSIPIEVESREKNIHVVAKVRNDNKIINQDFIIIQNCPRSPSDYWTLLFAAIIILFFGYVITWWWKSGSK